MSKGKLKTYIGAVLTNECDSNNHMNVMYYINKFELANRNLSYEIGLNREYFESENLGHAVLEQNIKYYKEVFEDDLLEIYSKVVGRTDKVIKSVHEMYDRASGKLCASMSVTAILFDMNKRKSVKLSEEIITKLDKLIKQ